MPAFFCGGAPGGPTASSFQSNTAPWLRKRMILKTNGVCLITFLVFECASCSSNVMTLVSVACSNTSTYATSCKVLNVARQISKAVAELEIDGGGVAP